MLRQRDGIRFRDLQIEFGPTLAETLVRQNCDPRYGARPLKRAVKRQVRAPLAAALNEQSSRTPLRAKVTAGKKGVRVKLHSRRSKKGRTGLPERMRLPTSFPKGGVSGVDWVSFGGFGRD